MNDIRQLLQVAARRLELIAFLGRLHVVAIIAAAVALALMLVDRMPSAPFVPWMWAGPALAALGIGVAAIMWARRRKTDMQVALAVDERLELREKLSTALHVAGRDDAFAQAAIEDAVVIARDGRTRERVRRGFAVSGPRGWWAGPLMILLAIILGFLPQMDLFAKESKVDPNVVTAKAQATQTIDAVVKAVSDKPELSKELSDMLGELSKEGTDPNAMRTPEEVKRDAIKKVTDFNKKLDDILSGEKGKTAEAVQKMLDQLKTPAENGPAKELADAMAKGDFAAAQQKLQELMDKLKDGQLNEEDKQKAAEQLKDIADQLAKLAQQQKDLEQALKQAGLDPQLAQNPQALQQAIQQNQNLNQQQKQQLQQMAQAQQAACKMCQGLGQACQQMAQGMQGGQPGQAGQGGQAMQDQLNQMEQLQQLLQQAQAAANACQGEGQGMCQGLGMNQAMQDWLKQCAGGGMGQRGIGQGGNAPIAKTPTGKKAEQANIKNTEGDIIAKTLFDGQQIRGESKAKLMAVIAQESRGFDEAQGDEQIHKKYEHALKHYFGEVEKLTKAIETDTKATDAVTPSPSEPADAEPQTDPGE